MTQNRKQRLKTSTKKWREADKHNDKQSAKQHKTFKGQDPWSYQQWLNDKT